MREASVKQRKQLIETNPALHLSLTRLAIRNIPRTVSSKMLKELARNAVVGFATDVKEGKRQKLSKEELNRGSQEMKEAEHERKKRGKGVVRQAKVVFETREGTKVPETDGTGRSRGYGFIEYYTHRCALMGLRWLNGYMVDYQTSTKKKGVKADLEEKKKRLVVEFAIENAQVVSRRRERKAKGLDRIPAQQPGSKAAGLSSVSKGSTAKDQRPGKLQRKRAKAQEDAKSVPAKQSAEDGLDADKLAKRQRIITQKRMVKRNRKKAG
jgi:nucleolar protein 4